MGKALWLKSIKIASVAFALAASFLFGRMVTTGKLVADAKNLLALPALGLILLSLSNWRWGIYGLLIYIPFAGVVTLHLHPWTLPLLFKDIFFLLPAYLSFAAYKLRKREAITFPGAPIWPMVCFAAIVVIYLLNPGFGSLAHGLVGVKVWLSYIPLYYVIYHLIDNKKTFYRLIWILNVLSIIPVIIGIIQEILVIYGKTDILLSYYLKYYYEIPQNIFGIVGPSKSDIFVRVPSTFTAPAQFFWFLFSNMHIAVALANVEKGKWRVLCWMNLALLIAAQFSCGTRAAYLFTPLALLAIYLFRQKIIGLAKVSISMGVLIPITLLIIGGSFQGRMAHVLDLAYKYLLGTSVGLFTSAVERVTPLGLGTGIATNPARYISPEPLVPMENYYGKVWVELGLPGLLIVLWLFASLVIKGYQAHKRLYDPDLKWFSVSILVYLVMVVTTQSKGFYPGYRTGKRLFLDFRRYVDEIALLAGR